MSWIFRAGLRPLTVKFADDKHLLQTLEAGSSRAELLSLGTIDILDPTALCCGDCLVHC